MKKPQPRTFTRGHRGRGHVWPSSITYTLTLPCLRRHYYIICFHQNIQVFATKYVCMIPS
ncbi:unnamed protein product [Prunus brigantina]